MEKIIHQIWMQGYDNMKESDKKNVEKIKEMHNDGKWEYIFWDDKKIRELLKNDELLLNKYNNYPHLVQKVDLAKLIILYNYGGIYLDIDVEIIKNLESLFEMCKDYNFVISNENNGGFLGNIVTCNSIKQCMNNGIILSKSKEDVCKFIIENLRTEYYPNKIDCVNYTTGPYIFNKIINIYKKKINKSKILELPNEYLEPCFHKECKVTNNTYTIHRHHLSWHDDNSYYSYLIYYCKEYNDYIYFILTIIVLIIVYKII